MELSIILLGDSTPHTTIFFYQGAREFLTEWNN